MAKNWFRSLTRRRSAKVCRPIRREGVALVAEELEQREVPAIYTVTWNGVGAQPPGSMSLQDAIKAANLNPGADQINYSVGVTSSLVTSANPLPTITDTVIIDGAPGGSGLATIQCISATSADPVQGFVVSAGSCVIKNMNIVDPNALFNGPTPEVGVLVNAAAGDFSLQNVTVQGFDGDGVQINNSPNNTIGGESAGQSVAVLANNGNGVHILGAGSTGNIVQQLTAKSNASDGVLIDTGASSNTIGGLTAVSTNVISLNTGNGIHLNNASGNLIQRNFVGTTPAGDAAAANARQGILVENGSSNNTIGSTDATAFNLISGNNGNGIYIRDNSSSGNHVYNTRVGISKAGDVAIANGGSGIVVENAPNTQIGDSGFAANYVSGNSQYGISITGAGAAGTVVTNNRIGINKAETGALGNTRDGISVTNGATGITIGTSATAGRNIIGGNRNGIALNTASNVTIQNNQIGFEQLIAGGTLNNYGNSADGILVSGSSGVQIGGNLLNTGNQISGNAIGVDIINSSTVTLEGNFIGTNLAGDNLAQPIANTGDGVVVNNSTNVAVGTLAVGGGNLISRNVNGVNIRNNSSNVRVQNDRIGTQISTIPDLGNTGDGVLVQDSSNVTIGGAAGQTGNTIAKNVNGIRLVNASGVQIVGNLVRNNAQSGIWVQNSFNNTIGGGTTVNKNTIANTQTYGGATFQLDGITLIAGSHDNTVQGNWIGTDSTGSRTFSNRGNGILINGAFHNLIGGTKHLVPDGVEQGNVIAYNWKNGIAVIEGSTPGSANGNSLLGNAIYSNNSFNNNALGIDLNDTSGLVDLNDAGDGDAGANNTQNFPVITLADATGGNTHIKGTLNSTANTTFRIEFYGSDEPNQSGTPVEYGQGKLYLGSINVLTDGSGNANIDFTSTTILQPLWVVSATATNQTTGDTSEFSQAMYVNTTGPNTYVVNNDGGFFTTFGDNRTVLNGTMTLARAITLANQHPGPDRIFFALRPEVTVSFDPTGAPIFTRIADSRTVLIDQNLPDITDTVVIDASRLAWPQNPTGVPYPGAPADGGLAQNYSLLFRNASNGIVISDNALPADATLNPNHNAQQVVIRNFPEITGSSGVGITIMTAKGGANLQNIQASAGGGSGVTGLGGINGFVNGAVLIQDSPNNIVGGADVGQGITIDKIGTGSGVHITGALSIGNLVQQTQIGKTFGVAGDGILIDGNSTNNVIGGFTTSPVNTGNLIVRSLRNGIHVVNSNGNRIQRNFIGNDGNSTAIPNALDGIRIENSANNLIGGQNLSAGNLISGNTENGIHIMGNGSANTQIQSNIIGLNAAGDTSLPNSGDGVLVEDAPSTFVGSTTTAANYISGNNLNGVAIMGAGSAGSIVVNNRIGIDRPVGDTKRGNVEDGVFVSGATNVTVGGGGTNAQNIIGGNRNGVAIVNGSTGIVVKGNWLGLNKLPDTTYPNVGNLQDGLFIQDSSNVQVGGTQSLEGNKSASNRNGIHIVNSSGVTLQGNYIGTNLTGTRIPIIIGLVEDFQPAAQSEDGVLVEGSSNIRIGTSAQGGGNLMSRNRHGISVTKNSSNVTIQNNRIGTQSTSPPSITPDDIGNLDDGISVDASNNVLIGGTGPNQGNIIAKNLDGIQISGGSSFVTVQQNMIRNNSQSGVRIENSFSNTIGGNTLAAKNTIMNRRLAGIDSTFTIDGVFIVAGSHDNVVQGNYIGTDSLTETNVGLNGNGVLIDGSSKNTIGMTTVAGTLAADVAAAANEGNLIAFNAFNGVAVVEATGSAFGNKLSGNSIYRNGLLGIDLGSTVGNVTLNDFQDVDTGANNFQNFPSLVSATSTSGTGTNVQGIFNSTPNRSFRIEFFHIDTLNTGGNLPNYGQAKTYIGSMNVTTDGNGDATINFTNPNIVLPAAQYITATATDLTTGDTSELGLDQAIAGAPGPITYVVNNDGNYFLNGPTGPGSKAVPANNPIILIPPNGTMTLAQAITLANQHPGDDRIVFSLNPEYTITPSGAITYYQESRWLRTNGDLPDITDTVIIDGSPLAWPQSKGGNQGFDLNYTIMFNGASHGFTVSDNATAQSQFQNPGATADLVVLRHMGVLGLNAPPGVGVELASKYGGANLQDMSISGFSSDGVRITNSPNNIVGGSGANQAVTITTVSGSGVNINGALSTHNLVQQTNIGTPVSASGTGGAGGNGIWIQNANNNTIGGAVAGSGVDIQGSGANGIYVINSSGTRIQRSTIGDAANNVFPNHFDGILIENSPLTLIGGVTADTGNTISGNTENGIRIIGVNSAGAQIQSNTIGSASAPNSGDGILVDNVANVAIGSTVTAANTITGNNLNGIELRGAGSTGARIVNTSVNSNLLDGIVVDGVPDVAIGGNLTSAGGTISGNRRGISVLNGSSKIILQHYTISTNKEEGIRIDSSSNILLGGTGSAIIGNTSTGNKVGIRVLNSSQVAIQGNTVSNQSEDGVIIDGSSNVSVGAPFQFGDNIITSNRNGVAVINGSSNFTIQNNEIGTNRVGSVLGNKDDGILLDGISGATVGGTQTLSGNFVSFNRNGLHLSGGTTQTTVLGNAFANSTESGMLLEGSSNNTIGGQTAAERNVISSNALNGIYLKPDFSSPFNPVDSNNNTIQGNFIGVGFDGTGNFGNGNAGIYIDGGSNNLIGGTVHDVKLKLEQGNVIGNSGANGIAVVQDNGPAASNAIRGNSIFGSGLLGIDLNGNTGLVDLNDPLDIDGGANLTQNFPEVTAAQAGSVGTMIQAKLSSAPSTTYHVEFFGTDISNATGSPNGYGQGKVFLGSTDVTTDASGNADNIDFVTLTPLASGWWVSATATDANGNTSEFGKAVQSTDATGQISGIKFNDLNGNGIQDNGEPGLPGWEIDLDYNNDTTIDLKTTTDATGHYTFGRLIDGVYSVAEVQKLGWIQTHAPVPNPVQITAGSAVSDVDFGNFKLIKISGTKFEDLNGNGKRDAGEGPLAGVVIDLYGFDAKTGAKIQLGETTTDLSGNYAFTNVGPGGPGSKGTPADGIYTKWEVHEKVPAGYTQTAPASGFYTISVISGTDVTGLEFGNKKGTSGGGGATGAQIVAGSGAGSTPLAIAYSAKGIQMFSIVPYATTFKGGVRVAKGDVNGDGVNDIIVAPGSGMAPLVKVYDGTTGKFMKQFYGFDKAWTRGVFVATADVNKDGSADIIVGADRGGRPEVRVYDGQTGIMLFQFNAYATNFTGGVRVAGGDVNGDGFADIVTAPGYGMAPTVRVFDGSNFGSGAAPAMLRQFNAYEPSFIRGVFVSTGNFDGDAFADIVTGPDSGRLPNVRVWAGSDGHLIKDLLANSTGFPPPPSQVSSDPLNTSGMRVATADIDGDGISDVITGPGVLKNPRIRVFNGATWTKILDFAGMPTNFLGGVYVG